MKAAISLLIHFNAVDRYFAETGNYGANDNRDIKVLALIFSHFIEGQGVPGKNQRPQPVRF